VIVMSYVELGRFAEALEHIRVWRIADPGPWTWAAAAYVYGRSGNRVQAEHAIEEMREEARGMRIDLQQLEAFSHAGLRDKDRVIAALEAGYVERSSMLNELKVGPQYDFLRDDPRFIDLMHRVGL
jgi:hypothetical protein